MMSDYRIECATREEWAERCLLAEAERDRLREKIAALYVAVFALFAIFMCGMFVVIAISA